MRSLSIAALVVAVVSAVPAYAAFTPAVFVSLIALILAAISCFKGERAWSAAVLLVVTATVAVSPVFTSTTLKQGWLAVVLVVPYVLFALAYACAMWRSNSSIGSG